MHAHANATLRTLLAGTGVLALAASPVLMRAQSAAQPGTVPDAARPHFSLKGAGETFTRTGEIREIKLNAIESGGRFTMVEGHLSPGAVVPAHFHKWHAEVFYVLDGQAEWTVGGETHLMTAGSLVYIPPGAVHSVKVVGDKEFHSLLTSEPGGHEYDIRRQQAQTQEERADPRKREQLMELNDFYLASAQPTRN